MFFSNNFKLSFLVSISLFDNILISPDFSISATIFFSFNNCIFSSDFVIFSSRLAAKFASSLLYCFKSIPKVLTNLSNLSIDKLNFCIEPLFKSSNTSFTISGTLGTTAFAADSIDIFALLKTAVAMSDIIVSFSILSKIAFIPSACKFGSAIIFYSYLFLCINQTKQHQHQQRLILNHFVP